jgi:hypothetical protein
MMKDIFHIEEWNTEEPLIISNISQYNNSYISNFQ